MTLKGGHNVPLIAAMIFTTILFVVAMVINYMGNDPEKSGGIFIHDMKNLSDKYHSTITPAGWTFSIWGFIYAWQAVIIIYFLSSIFRKTPEGPVYTSPTLLPLGFFLFFGLSIISGPTWLIVFDREYIVPAACVLFASALTLYITMGITYYNLNKHERCLEERGRIVEVRLIKYIVQNGIGLVTGWTTVACLLNLGMVLSYKLPHPLSLDTSGTVCLFILGVELALFTALDLTILDKFSRNIFTPYLAIIIALIGSIAKNWDPTKANSIVTAILMAIACVSIILKFVMMFVRRGRSSSADLKHEPL